MFLRPLFRSYTISSHTCSSTQKIIHLNQWTIQNVILLSRRCKRPFCLRFTLANNVQVGLLCLMFSMTRNVDCGQWVFNDRPRGWEVVIIMFHNPPFIGTYRFVVDGPS